MAEDNKTAAELPSLEVQEVVVDELLINLDAEVEVAVTVPEKIALPQIYVELRERLKTLCEGAHQAGLQLFMPPVAGNLERAERMLTALADALESFWTDVAIPLELFCEPGEEGVVASALPSVPRLCVNVTGKGRASVAERSALALASPWPIILQFDFGCFPVKPVGYLPLVSEYRRSIELLESGALPLPDLVVATANSVPSPVRVIFRDKEDCEASLTPLMASVPLFGASEDAVSSQLFATVLCEEIVALKGAGWAAQPWTHHNSPFFVAVTDWADGDIEPAIGFVYASIHR